jgi:hypothetical protein
MEDKLTRFPATLIITLHEESNVQQFHSTYFYFVSELTETYCNSHCNKIKREERKISFKIKGLFSRMKPFTIRYTVPVNDEYIRTCAMW